MNESLRDEILSMMQADRDARTKFILLIRRTNEQGGQLDYSSEEFLKVQEIDRQNAISWKRILKSHGWPSRSEVGDEAAYAVAFMVAHHAPPEIVEKAEPLLREAVDLGEAAASALAEVEDRLAVIRGEPQRFGTQWRQVDDGPYEPYPIVDPDTVDERRRQVGLSSLADHVKQMRATFGDPQRPQSHPS